MPCCQRYNLIPLTNQERIINDNELKASGVRCGLDGLGVVCDSRIIRINENGKHGSLGHEFAQQFQPLWSQQCKKEAYPSGIPAWPVEARHKTQLDRITAGREDDR